MTKPKVRIDARSLDMASRRAQGQTYKAIGAAWGVSAQTAYATVERVRSKVRAALKPKVVMLGAVAYMAPSLDLTGPIEFTLTEPLSTIEPEEPTLAWWL
jgi:DNA-binding CsgD family transcriptional regulator